MQVGFGPQLLSLTDELTHLAFGDVQDFQAGAAILKPVEKLSSSEHVGLDGSVRPIGCPEFESPRDEGVIELHARRIGTLTVSLVMCSVALL